VVFHEHELLVAKSSPKSWKLLTIETDFDAFPMVWYGSFPKPSYRVMLILLQVYCVTLSGCAFWLDARGPFQAWVPRKGEEYGNVKPSNTRKWRPDLAVLPFAKLDNTKIKLYNIRDCRYRTEDDYDLKHFDTSFKISDLQTVDFLVVPFKDAPVLAHTMLSFGVSNGDQIVVSVEARLERDEEYTPMAGALKQYELIYILGTERDLVRLRTDVRRVEVFLYRAKATPEEVQALFLDIIKRVNTLAKQPEFYDTLTNNCTTNLVTHVNNLRPGTIPADLRILFPGYSDQLIGQLGLIEGNAEATAMRARAAVLPTPGVQLEAAEYSKKIRSRY
jgi:hypothetical protein